VVSAASRIAIPPSNRHPIILFDGDCVLCSGFARFVIRHDSAGRFRLATMQVPIGQAILAELGLPLSAWESNVLIEDGVAYLKSTAFLRVVRHLDRPWPLLALSACVPIAARDRLYDIVARTRYRVFGRRTSCFVPGPEIASRFLEP
jgi:predicted DCC family thiol-disulfide oxidoreductase YuxK